MTRAQLLAQAQKYGVSGGGSATKKADLIKALEGVL